MEHSLLAQNRSPIHRIAYPAIRIIILLSFLMQGSCAYFKPQPEVAPAPSPPAQPAPPAGPEAFLLSENDPILAGLVPPKGVRRLIANRGPYERYPPEKGKVSYVKKSQKASDGGHFNIDGLVAAHKELPLGAIVRCTRLDNGKSVIVVIRDRGPYIQGRILDLSRAAAHKIGLNKEGVVPAKIEVLAYPYEKNTEKVTNAD